MSGLLRTVKRIVIAAAVLGLLGGIFLAVTWRIFFRYVAPGQMMILIAKAGEPLPPGRILAKPGQKGIREEVYGEGRHFVWPVLYETEIRDAVRIPAGKVGIVRAKVGTPLPPGRILAEEGEQGIRRRLLPPGLHRLNPYGYEIEVRDVDARNGTRIPIGYVGIVTSLVGDPPPPGSKFAGPGQRGVREEVLAPGIYYLNPYELRVDIVEVGIRQVSFLEEKRNPLQFPSSDGFPIHLDATVEWEILPENAAAALLEFGDMDKIEDRVIIPQTNSIGRLQGSTYGAKDFLLGAGREKFQHSFTEELTRIGGRKWVAIHSAFIRNILIPEALLKPIQDSVVAVEKRKTAAVQEDMKKSAADLQREQSLIEQRRLEVLSETSALTATITAGMDREVAGIEAATRLAVAEKQREIARLEADRTKVLGEAEATVTGMRGNAQAEAFRMKVEAFGGDAAAFARYTFTQSLPPDLKVRLVHAGPGTLWTDLKGTAGVGALSGMKILEEGARPAPEAPKAP